MNNVHDDILDKDISAIFNWIECESIQELINYISNQNTSIWLLKNNDINVLHKASFRNRTQAITAIIQETSKRLINNQELFHSFLNEKTLKGLTPLHYAALMGNIQIAKILIENGATYDAITSSGMNAMHFAAQGDQTSSLVYFKDKYNLSINSRDNVGNTPLHWAASLGKEISILFILQWVDNANPINKKGQTPLHQAVLREHSKTIKKLLQNGGDLTIKDNDNKTCVDIAKDNKFDEIAKIFKKRNICETLFFRPSITKKQCSLMNVFLFIFLHFFVFISTFIIVLPVFDSIYLSSVYSVILLGVFIMFFIMICSDPGNLTPIFKRNMLAIVEKGDNLNEYCPYCIHLKAYTTKHCLICNKCIDSFDHHCFWINNCIGLNNYFRFIGFLIITVSNNLMNIIISSVSCGMSIDLSLEESQRVPFIINGIKWLYYPWTRRSVSIATIMICILFIYPVISILFSQRKTVKKMKNRKQEKKDNSKLLPLLVYDEISINESVFIAIDIDSSYKETNL